MGQDNSIQPQTKSQPQVARPAATQKAQLPAGARRCGRPSQRQRQHVPAGCWGPKLSVKFLMDFWASRSARKRAASSTVSCWGDTSPATTRTAASVASASFAATPAADGSAARDTDRDADAPAGNKAPRADPPPSAAKRRSAAPPRVAAVRSMTYGRGARQGTKNEGRCRGPAKEQKKSTRGREGERPRSGPGQRSRSATRRKMSSTRPAPTKRVVGERRPRRWSHLEHGT